MAGDEDKKKKKKGKKTDKEQKAEDTAAAEAAAAAPAGAEEPKPPAEEPWPPTEEAWPPADTEEAWPPAADDSEEAPAEAPAEAVEGEVPAEEGVEPPPAPKKKPKFFVHWNRKKARFYDYNWDYGGNYYSSLVSYIDIRAGDYPRRMAFAERGIRSNVARRTYPDVCTSRLLDDVRKSIRNFELSQKTYMK